MQKRDGFNILSHTFRWTDQEIAMLFPWEMSKIKKLLYKTPFKGATPVYKQKDIDAYWDDLMNRMPEGREPEYRPS